MIEHKCDVVFERSFDNGRTIKIGKITEVADEFKNETHCLHITSPVQETVNLMNMSDAGYMAILSYVLNNNEIVYGNWIRRMLGKGPAFTS